LEVGSLVGEVPGLQEAEEGSLMEALEVVVEVEEVVPNLEEAEVVETTLLKPIFAGCRECRCRSALRATEMTLLTRNNTEKSKIDASKFEIEDFSSLPYKGSC
jgi:hypothetical protein